MDFCSVLTLFACFSDSDIPMLTHKYGHFTRLLGINACGERWRRWNRSHHMVPRHPHPCPVVLHAYLHCGRKPQCSSPGLCLFSLPSSLLFVASLTFTTVYLCMLQMFYSHSLVAFIPDGKSLQSLCRLCQPIFSTFCLHFTHGFCFLFLHTILIGEVLSTLISLLVSSCLVDAHLWEPGRPDVGAVS